MMNERKQASGFTLMESVIAIGIVAVLLTTFLAVFGPATQGIRRAISVQEADRLASALEHELQILREDESNDYDTAFDKAFQWIEESGNESSAILLYNYRGDPSNITDGRMDAYSREGGEPGKDFVLQSAVRRQGDKLIEDELEVAAGPVYLVTMVQLIFENQSLTTGEPGKIVDPHDGGKTASDADQYSEAVIAFSASFYVLKSNSTKYVENLKFEDADGDGRPDNLGRPLFSRNLAVRR